MTILGKAVIACLIFAVCWKSGISDLISDRTDPSTTTTGPSTTTTDPSTTTTGLSTTTTGPSTTTMGPSTTTTGPSTTTMGPSTTIKGPSTTRPTKSPSTTTTGRSTTTLYKLPDNAAARKLVTCTYICTIDRKCVGFDLDDSSMKCWIHTAKDRFAKSQPLKGFDQYTKICETTASSESIIDREGTMTGTVTITTTTTSATKTACAVTYTKKKDTHSGGGLLYRIQVNEMTDKKNTKLLEAMLWDPFEEKILQEKQKDMIRLPRTLIAEFRRAFEAAKVNALREKDKTERKFVKADHPYYFFAQNNQEVRVSLGCRKKSFRARLLKFEIYNITEPYGIGEGRPWENRVWESGENGFSNDDMNECSKSIEPEYISTLACNNEREMNRNCYTLINIKFGTMPALESCANYQSTYKFGRFWFTCQSPCKSKPCPRGTTCINNPPFCIYPKNQQLNQECTGYPPFCRIDQWCNNHKLVDYACKCSNRFATDANGKCVKQLPKSLLADDPTHFVRSNYTWKCIHGVFFDLWRKIGKKMKTLKKCGCFPGYSGRYCETDLQVHKHSLWFA